MFKRTKLIFLSVIIPAVGSASSLTVAGKCHKEVTPDRVSLTMTTTALEKEPKLATAKASAAYERLLKEIKKLNLKDSQTHTSGFVVSQQWDYGTNNKRVLRGYSTNVSLTVETSEVGKAGELLDIAAKLNIDEVSTPQTFLSNALERKEYESCLETAIKHARGKAEKMAAASGHALGKMISLSEFKKDSDTPVPTVGMQERAFSDATAKLSFESKPSVIDVTVYADYALK